MPEGATHLFLSAGDDFWSDNSLTDFNQFGVRITKLYEGRFVGDYDFSGVVDGGDFLEWQRQFGQSGLDLTADGNLDGVVDAADRIIWEQYFGATVGSQVASQAVPEPATLALLGLAAGLLITGHSRPNSAFNYDVRNIGS